MSSLQKKGRTTDANALLPLDRAELVAAVPRLAPETLHALVRRSGLEDSVDLVEAATDTQLAALLDIDLWDSSRVGSDARFDVDRFGDWIEALVEHDAVTAARVVTRLDPSVVVAGLSRYVRVVDPGVLEPSEATDDEPTDRRLFVAEDLEAEIGGYLVQACRPRAWDAIVGLLVELAAGHAARFDLVMRRCRLLANAGREADGLDELLDAPEQQLHDVAVEREDRRAVRGFVSPAEARAFLALARRGRSGRRAAVRVAASMQKLLPAPASAASRCAPEAEPFDLGSLMENLREAAPDAALARSRELAFLANALVAGCRLQGDPFTPEQAAAAGLATCSLGLRRQPVRPGPDHLRSHDLTGVFQDGWAALHGEVSLGVGEGLRAILKRLGAGRSDTGEELQALARSLERHLAAGAPWLVRDELDVLQVLDAPAWCGLRSEFPVLSDAVTAIVEGRVGHIDPHAFAYIEDDTDIAVVRAFVARLPRLFAG